jgi:hypothetical protein
VKASHASHAAHLVRRFAGSLSAREISWDDERWVRASLLPGELDLWRGMSTADRAHAVGVARQVAAALGAEATRPVIAAALLHDVGKIESGLGTFARALATVWRRAPMARVRAYSDHAAIGGRLLAAAGSDPLTITWAEDHHLPRERWRLDPVLASALKSADDD